MHILAEFTPWDPVGATRPTVRAASVQDRRVTGLNGVKWWPAITVKPSLSMRLFDGDFSSDVEPGDVSITLLVDKLVKADANAGRYRWAGAKMTLYAGNLGDAWPWTTVFQGLVTRFEADGNRLKLSGSVDSEPFATNALTATYAGTGLAEGGADLKNTPKPWLFGRCSNCEPVLINSVDNVYQFSGYGPIQAVNVLYERANDFGAAVGDYASYAALVAATIRPGQWGTCLALGLIRLGAPAFGVITADVDGDKPSGTWLRKTGEIVQRIASNAGVSGGLVDATSWNALDAALVTLLPSDGRIGFYLTEQTSVIDVARRLARPCNAQAGISWLGKLFAVRVAIGTPAITLDAQGRRLPGVSSSIEVDVSPPYWRIEMGAERSWRVHTYDEIATYAPLLDRGAYSASETYREGNIVQNQSMSWLYINPTAASGNAPPTLPTTSNTYWKALDAKLGGVATGATINIITYSASAPSSPVDGDIWIDTSVTPNIAKVRVGGGWQSGANLVTQGTDIGVANGATKNIVTRSSSAPGSPVDGDIWVDTSVTPNLVKVRVSGAWQTSANYVTQGTDIGVANGATKNTVTRSSSAPASPTDGDIWIDTSVTPNLFKTRVSGAWQIGANYVTAGTDIGVANGASNDLPLTTIGSDTETVVGNTFQRTGTNTSFGGGVVGPPLTGPQFAEADIIAGNIYTTVSLDDDATSYTPGTNLLAVCYYNNSTGDFALKSNAATISSSGPGAGATGKLRVEYDGGFFKLFIGGVQYPTTGGNIAASSPTLKLWPKWLAYNSGQLYTGLKAGPTSLGIVAAIIGPADILINCDSSGTPITGELDKLYQYKVYEAGAALTTGVTWTRTTPTGITTTVTGTGGLDFGVTALSIAPIEVTLTGSRVGKADVTFKVTIRKNLAPPASGSTGGTTGGTVASQTSAFTSVSSGTAAAITGELAMTTGTGGVVTLSAALDIKGARSSPIGDWYIRFQWYRWNGSAYVAIGSTFDGSDAAVWQDSETSQYFNNPPGNVSSTTTYTSSNGTAEKFKLYAFIISGSSTNTTKVMSFTGQVSAQG